NAPRRRSGRLSFTVKNKLGTGQNALKRLLNPPFKVSGLAPRLKKTHQPMNIGVAQITAIRTPRKCGDDPTGARFFFCPIGRTADENATTAGCVAGTGRFERAGHTEHFEVRMTRRIPRICGTADEGLQTGRIDRGTSLQESGSDDVRAGFQSKANMT